MAGKPQPLGPRFWAKVDRSRVGRCWPWIGAKNGGEGYGVIFRDGRPALAHRVSWELHNGPIPDGLGVLHRCDNPPCVNPRHLFVGSNADNNRDKISKGRSGCVSGEDHPGARLTAALVRAIRRERGAGLTLLRIADKYGIGTTQASRICRGVQWRNA
jgi:hypothetical protein